MRRCGARSNGRRQRHRPRHPLAQEGPAIRAIAEYQSFWVAHTHTHPLEKGADGHVGP
jgi:hypothetical protein